MISKKIAVFENNNFFIGDSIFNNEPNLAMFQYKTTNDKFMKDEELHNIKMQGSEGVLKSFNLINICFVITFIILLYSFSKVMPLFSRSDSTF